MMIKVDIDHRKNYKKTKKWINYKLHWINFYFPILPATVVVHRTKKGFHFRITLREPSKSKLIHKYEKKLNDYSDDCLDNKDIIIIQCCLGSDWLREIRNLNRVKSGMTKDWNLLFNQKFTANKVISKEKYVAKYVLKK